MLIEDSISHTLYNRPELSVFQYFLNYREHAKLTQWCQNCAEDSSVLGCDAVSLCYQLQVLWRHKPSKHQQLLMQMTASHPRKPSAHSAADLIPKTSLVDK